MSYLLDANVFIQAKNHHYAMDFCPAFWDGLIQENAKGNVHSIDKVGEELTAGTDAVAKWAAERSDGFFLPPDEAMLGALGTVSTWVHRQQYRRGAINTFLQDADYYLIAHALAHRHVVVTHEVPGDGIKEVKIPEVCIGVRVKSVGPFQMLRRARARFVLASSREAE
jgi:hypothetical protein